MASQYSIDSSRGPKDQPVFLHGFDKILRAGRVEFTPSSEQRADSALIKTNDFNHHLLGVTVKPANERFHSRNQSQHLQYSNGNTQTPCTLAIPVCVEKKIMRGKRLSFPKNRRLILDICHVAKSVPSFPVERTFQLGELRNARDRAETRISWVALYTRAFSLVCHAIPELRQVFVAYPTPRFYEHPHSVASISVHRDDPTGGKRLIWGRIDNAEETGLVSIQRRLDAVTQGPLNEVFKDGMRLEKLPAPLRRFSWWMAMNVQGRQRAKKIGTFSISTLAGENTLNRDHPLVTTSSLAYSRCNEDGSCLVTLIADHRVLDGMLAAQALGLLETKLVGQVLDELSNLQRKTERLSAA